MKNIRIIVSVVIAVLTLSACGIKPGQINFSDQEIKTIDTVVILQQNCNGSAEVENTVEKTRTITYSLQQQFGQTIDARGKVGAAGIAGIELGASVAKELGVTYGLSENITRAITVKARPGTNMRHTIQLNEIWKTGMAMVEVNKKQTTLPFSIRVDFELALIDSEDIHCPDGTATPEMDSSLAPTQTAIAADNGELVFNEDFETGTTNQFVTKAGKWQVITDETGNHVYQADKQSSMINKTQIKLENFKNGVIQFKMRYREWTPKDSNPGIGYLFFRLQGQDFSDAYTVQCGFDWKTCIVNYVPNDPANDWPVLSKFSVDFTVDQWYELRVEVNDNQIVVYLNGVLVAEETDNLSRLTSGRVGFQVGPNTTVQYDDIQVWEKP
jgi:hypothetical protein